MSTCLESVFAFGLVDGHCAERGLGPGLRDPTVKDVGRPMILLFGLELVDGFAEWGLAHETFRVRCALRRRRSALRIIAVLYAVVIACRSR